MTEIIAGILVGAGASGVMSAAVQSAVDKQRNEFATLTTERLANYISQEEAATIDRADELCDMIAKFDETEKDMLKESMENWDHKNGYSEHMDSLVKERKSAIEKLKSDLRVEECIRDVTDKANEKIREFDEANGISAGIQECESTIADAKAKYDHSKTMVDIFDHGDAGDAMKKAAKKVKNATIAEQEEKINQLRKMLEDEKTKINSELNAQKAEISKAYTDAKKNLADRYDKDIRELRESRDAFRKEALGNIISNREDSEIELRKECERTCKRANDIESRVADELSKSADSMSQIDLIASWCKSHKWSKPKVIAIASLPLIPFGYAGYKYVKAVAAVVSKI